MINDINRKILCAPYFGEDKKTDLEKNFVPASIDPKIEFIVNKTNSAPETNTEVFAAPETKRRSSWR